MSLSDTAIKNAKPQDKPFKVTDEKGMYLLVHSNGSKYFRLDYRFNGKRKTLALGTYPETTLKEARENRDTAKKQINDGIDPSEHRKTEKLTATTNAANSFEAIALEWFGRHMADKSESHKKRTLSLMQRDLFPSLNKPLAEIKPPELLATIRKIEARGAVESAHKAMQLCAQVFRYAVVTGRAERDITPDLKGALKTAKGGQNPQ